MPRKSDVENVENEAVETEEVETIEGGEKKATAKKEPKRGELPEGYVTPVGLAKVLTEKGMHKNRAGEVTEVKPQMVYSYIRNSSKEDPFPIEIIKDSIGAERQVVKLDNALAWWERKNERAATRAANAKAKAEKKAEKAAAKPEEAPVEAEAEVVEAG